MNILFQVFRFVKDFRSKRGQRYELSTILTIIFSAFCCGSSTYQEIYQFSQENAQFFIDFLNITSRKLPSYSTIRRVIMGLEEEDFFSIFYPMIDSNYDHEDVPDYIAIDGKTLKGTVTNYKEKSQNTLNVVSAFSCEENLIVVITDRTDLEKQLAESAVLTGEPMQKAKNVRQLEQLLAQEGAGLVFGMIQKFRGDTDTEEENSNNNQINISNNLNPSEDILVFIDEAHRSHTNTLHLNLSQALPNCAKIGFTGTPIVKSMLLTGFNAPLEQVLYLDRAIKEHELLQAIACVNQMLPQIRWQKQ